MDKTSREYLISQITEGYGCSFGRKTAQFIMDKESLKHLIYKLTEDDIEKDKQGSDDLPATNFRGLDLGLEDLKKAIVEVLKNCPDNTCRIVFLTSKVCDHLQLIARAESRLLRIFKLRLMKVLNQLKEQSIVEECNPDLGCIRLIDIEKKI